VANQIKDEIQSLSPREHVRLRPGMYISNVDNPNHLLIETFANALDMHNAGYGNIITVTIDDNNICTCQDEGTGFQINTMNEDNSKTILQMAFDTINSSGKYTTDGFYSGSSLGANGVGQKAVNFLSEWLEVISWNYGEYEKLRFEKGILVSRESGKYKDNSSGTIVKYLPDKEIFDSIVTDKKYFEKFFTEISYICNNLTIKYNGKIIHNDSIEKAIDDKVKTDIELINNRFIFQEKNLNLAMTYVVNSSNTLTTYVNYGQTDAGPHITALKTTITRILNKWAKEQGILKEKDKLLDGTSLQEGLILVSNIVSPNVVYDSQSKHRVTKIDTSVITSDLASQLEIWLDNNPSDGKAIVEKALVARKAAEAAKKAREAIKNKNSNKNNNKKKIMPAKLADCSSKNRTKCELYVTEGDSASGGAKIIRDATFQAVLGLRGKILNCLTATPAQIAKNEEVIGIINALGLDYLATAKEFKVYYEESKIRYDKFIIAADKDPDGSHIQTLVLTLIITLIPELLTNGHVYVALPPLYKAEWGTKYQYIQDREELKVFEKEHKGNYSLTYFKGLGEASPEELGNMIINPETRNIIQVTTNNFKECLKLIEDLMGKDSQPKKDFVFGGEN